MSNTSRPPHSHRSEQPENRVSNISGIIDRPPGDLKPWPGNPRKHPAKQIAKLKASIQQFGFTAPVLVDEAGVILSGHGRTEASMELGFAKVPIRVITGLTQSEKRAYVIADNKIPQLSEWDTPLLKDGMGLLLQDNFDIETTGFSTAEIDIMFDEGAEPDGIDPDDLQPKDIAEEVLSRPGDLWTLGDHRLICGDALNVESYKLVMQKDRAQMVITDPPYNVPINGHVSGKGKVKHKEFAMASGEMTQMRISRNVTADSAPS